MLFEGLPPPQHGHGMHRPTKRQKTFPNNHDKIEREFSWKNNCRDSPTGFCVAFSSSPFSPTSSFSTSSSEKSPEPPQFPHQRTVEIEASTPLPQFPSLEANYSLIDAPTREGSYGCVHLAQHRASGTVYALKRFKRKACRPAARLDTTTRREISILQSLSHENIVTTKEVVADNDGNVYMVLAYEPHDLRGLMLTRQVTFVPAAVKTLLVQILRGAAYLHSKAIVHRDLKTNNLLLNNSGELKICDFGMSRYLGPDMTPGKDCVTRYYRAPELLLGEENYGTGVDIWSIGCIFTELVLGKPLFRGASDIGQLHAIFKILGTPTSETWPGLSDLAPIPLAKAYPRNRMRKYFSKDLFSTKHLSKSGIDLLNQMLRCNPDERISAEDALRHPWFAEEPSPQPKHLMPRFYDPNSEIQDTQINSN